MVSSPVLVLFAALIRAAAAEVFETVRADDGWCSYATCGAEGHTIEWAHGQDALIRHCPSTSATTVQLRMRTAEQRDGNEELVYVLLENRDREVILQQLVTITPIMQSFSFDAPNMGDDGLWVVLKTGNTNQAGSPSPVSLHFEMTFAADTDALKRSGDPCNRPSPPPPALAKEVAEINRNGDDWCTFATCGADGVTINWDHGADSLTRSCVGKETTRFQLRMRTVEQREGHSERVEVILETKSREIVGQQVVDIGPALRAVTLTSEPFSEDLWLVLKTANTNQYGSPAPVSLHYEMVFAAGPDSVADAGDVCDRPSPPPPTRPPPSPPPPPTPPDQPPSSDDDGVPLSVVIPAVVVPVVLLLVVSGFLCYAFRRERAGRPIFHKMETVQESKPAQPSRPSASGTITDTELPASHETASATM